MTDQQIINTIIKGNQTGEDIEEDQDMQQIMSDMSCGNY